MNKLHVLALDLGSTTGYAHNPSVIPGGIISGSKLWRTPAELRAARKSDPGLRGSDPRVLGLSEWLGRRRDEAASRLDPGTRRLLVWEDVQFATSTAQTQLWSSFRTVLWLTFTSNWERMPVPVGTLKKWATGSGAARKGDMALALARRYPNRFIVVPARGKKETGLLHFGTNIPLDDNEVDAIWLYEYAHQHA